MAEAQVEALREAQQVLDEAYCVKFNGNAGVVPYLETEQQVQLNIV